VRFVLLNSDDIPLPAVFRFTQGFSGFQCNSRS